MPTSMFSINPWEALKTISETTSATLWYFFIKPFWWFWLTLIVLFIGRRVIEDWIFRRKNKKCPHCAEYIKKEAKSCRYCGKDV